MEGANGVPERGWFYEPFDAQKNEWVNIMLNRFKGNSFCQKLSYIRRIFSVPSWIQLRLFFFVKVFEFVSFEELAIKRNRMKFPSERYGRNLR